MAMMMYYGPYDEDEMYGRPKPWKCKLCSVENSRGETECRVCDFPRFNMCTKCRKQLDDKAHFCKYCGAMSVFFRANVYDAKEREYARKHSREEISYWRKRGVRYFQKKDIADYHLQIQAFGEIRI